MKRPRKLTREWNRTFWGVQFISDLENEAPILLGSLWRTEVRNVPYPDEPSRPILFRTRSAARNWCKTRMEENSKRLDFISRWKFRPVKVREQVFAIEERKVGERIYAKEERK